jgi:hypothetical protein
LRGRGRGEAARRDVPELSGGGRAPVDLIDLDSMIAMEPAYRPTMAAPCWPDVVCRGTLD